MVNVGNGNFILQADDVDMHERGIDLAFRRTYNSQSRHDANNTDGSTPSVFGNRWTNTFDAHLSYNVAANVITFYDIDGARYDYTSNGNGGWTPPAGDRSTLSFDGTCGYYVIEKNGTTYHMYAPYAICGTPVGYFGRLYQIVGRNQNNAINFSYAWSGDASNPEQLTQILAQHTDGQTLTMNFSQFGSYVELSSLVRPDGLQLNYSYDSSGNLLEVDRPGNNSANVLPESYAWSGTPSAPIITVYSPRATIASRQGSQDGAFYTVDLDSANRAIQTYVTGLFNPTPTDGTATPIQSGAAWSVIDSRTYSGYGTGSTVFSDSYGHALTFIIDSSARETQRSEWTGALYLTMQRSWDSANDLLAEIDARGYERDYAYDSNGNTIAVAQPSVTSSAGTFRPTQLYTYDSFNNVVAYCDAVTTHSLGLDWTSSPSGSECPKTSVAAQYQYTYPTYEPFGELTVATTQATSYAPSGYSTTYQYNSTQQGGADYGLPTTVLGTSIAQIDGSTRTPQQNFWYDGHGNIACYGKGNGYWVLQYDLLNRMTVAADPDDSATGAGICAKAGVPGWTTYTSTTYYADGSISQTQDASERAGSYNTTFTYDADGNAVSETRHFGCTSSSCAPGITSKFYDGADRLVEVQEPNGESSRNKYDIGAADMLALQNGSTSFRAYGGIYATQVLAPSSTLWMDSKGFSYDAMDRVTTKIAYAPGTTGNVGQSDLPSVTTTLAYDTDSNHLGLLSSSTNGVGTVTSYAYNADGQITSTSFSDATPSRSITYDPDGRTASLVASNGIVAYSYDAAGKKSSQSETNGSNALTISYQYYADGLRSGLSVQGALSASALRTYAYRNDGSASYHGFSYGSTTNTFAWTYTNGRRQLTFLDPWFSKTTAYDTFGRISTDSLETGSYTNFAYDGEGDVVSYTGLTNYSNPSLNIPASQSAAFAYDQVGQNTKESFTNSLPNPTVSSVQTPLYGCADTTGCDDRTGAQVTRKPNHYSPVGGTTYAYTFDGAGRQAGQNLAWAYNTTCSEVSRGVEETYPCFISGSYATLRGYDAEDHLVAESPHTPTGQALSAVGCGPTSPYPNPGGGNPAPQNSGPTPVQVEYTFWPDGHLQSSTNGASQLFWDGDTLLYVLGAPGFSTVYLDDYALFDLPTTGTPGTAGLIITDRDYAGRAVSEHIAAGQSGWSPNGIFQDHFSCYKNYAIWSNSTATIPNNSPPIVLPRRDGISDEYNTFQGARAYDDNAGQWVSPDAYSGDADDPKTQRSYMWNNNNPYRYEDPSGYCPMCAAVAVPVIEIGAGEILTAAGAGAAGAVLIGQGRQILNSVGHALQSGIVQQATSLKSDDNPYTGPVSRPVIAVDPWGNAIPVPEGGKIDSSPNGRWQQVIGPGNKPNGTRIDDGHRGVKSPNAQQPHAHVPGLQTGDGDPHIPINRGQGESGDP